MINLAHQTADIRQCKWLKKFGLTQCTYVSLYVARQNDSLLKKGEYEYRHTSMSKQGWDNYYAALTDSELGEVLPEWVYSKLNSSGEGDRWICAMMEHMRLPSTIKSMKIFYAETEAIARAKMLIYLLSRRLVSIHAVNKILRTHSLPVIVKQYYTPSQSI